MSQILLLYSYIGDRQKVGLLVGSRWEIQITCTACIVDGVALVETKMSHEEKNCTAGRVFWASRFRGGVDS